MTASRLAHVLEPDGRESRETLNYLDGLYASVESVQSVWHRRGWFADLVRSACGDRERIRVLDVACGGSRYVRDLIDGAERDRLDVTWVDEDAAALAFIEHWLARVDGAHHRFLCAPVRRLAEILPVPTDDARRFDVVLATGLLDYLPDAPARTLLAHMAALARPGGRVAVCNFSPDDRSRIVKEWISDWPLVYRTEDELAALFPSGVRVAVDRSPDGGLVYATGRIASGV